MIDSLTVCNYLTFKEAKLDFHEGLIAFTGASGAGKSVLINALLASLGFVDADASSLEVVISEYLPLEDFGLEGDEPNILKCIKQKSIRYFINGQSVSKRTIRDILNKKVLYLSVRDNGEFESSSMISFLDKVCIKENFSHENILSEYRQYFEKKQTIFCELNKILEEEKKVVELKEFAEYEISRIDRISPKIGEDEELMEFKKELSRKEKLQNALLRAMKIFDSQNSVLEVLNLLNIDVTFFDASMNELQTHLEGAKDRLNELEEVNIEELLNRIEVISGLKNRFGSIEDALEYRSNKIIELERYKNLTFEKESLQKEYDDLLKKIEVLAIKLHESRKKCLPIIINSLNSYLANLYLPSCELILKSVDFTESGQDILEMRMGDVDIRKISSGEYNRLRLAFIASMQSLCFDSSGVLIVDEIDSNLSGKEAMSVANVLKELSSSYQIFAISHQPQLSSKADQHFYVYKEKEESHVSVLNSDERINELARMVSGEHITQEALEFAASLLKD